MKNINEIIEEYLGTCEPLREEYLNDLELCRQIDELMFKCDCCDWWYEIAELENNHICTDCYKEGADG